MNNDLAAAPSADVSAATFSFAAVEGFHASLLAAAPPTIRSRATQESWTTTALIAALQKTSAPSDSTGDPPKAPSTTTSHQHLARSSGAAAGGIHDSVQDNDLGLNGQLDVANAESEYDLAANKISTKPRSSTGISPPQHPARSSNETADDTFGSSQKAALWTRRTGSRAGTSWT